MNISSTTFNNYNRQLSYKGNSFKKNNQPSNNKVMGISSALIGSIIAGTAMFGAIGCYEQYQVNKEKDRLREAIIYNYKSPDSDGGISITPKEQLELDDAIDFRMGLKHSGKRKTLDLMLEKYVSPSSDEGTNLSLDEKIDMAKTVESL